MTRNITKQRADYIAANVKLAKDDPEQLARNMRAAGLYSMTTFVKDIMRTIKAFNEGKLGVKKEPKGLPCPTCGRSGWVFR